MSTTLAVIDDRKNERRTLTRNISNTCKSLKLAANVISHAPLANCEEYPSWIAEKEVKVLIIDEKLDQMSDGPTSKHVHYKGHDLALYLRKKMPEFPIFVVTTYPNDQEILDNESTFERVFDRRIFPKELNTHVPRIVRAGQNFTKSHESELRKLGELSVKIAKGSAKSKDITAAKAIQKKLGLISEKSDSISEPGTKLSEISKKLKELERLISIAKKTMQHAGEKAK